MEENNPQTNINQLCKMGCGYFGSSNFDGFCSQCFKEKEKQFEKEQIAASFSFKEKPFGDVQEVISTDLESDTIIPSTNASIATSSSTSSFSSIFTGDTAKSDISNNSDSNSNTPVTNKKNRCQICRKKVGLTGFSCRCGGMFCSIHRYSDSHSCTFDYKEEAERAIRKANPRIVSDKIAKI